MLGLLNRTAWGIEVKLTGQFKVPEESETRDDGLDCVCW